MEKQQRFLDNLRVAQRNAMNTRGRWGRGYASDEDMEAAYDALCRAYLDAAEYGPSRLRRLYYRLAAKYAPTRQGHVL